MGNQARKLRKQNGVKFEKAAKVPTRAYATKSQEHRSRQSDARMAEEVTRVAAQFATWPPSRF